jgi:hypothetical protein
MTSQIDYRPLNVALRPRCRALHRYASRAGESGEARTDPDVEDMIHIGEEKLLGWYPR